MANDDREAFFRKASNYFGGEPESWEKTHDEFGNYIGSSNAGARQYYAQPSQSFQSAPVNRPQYQSDVAARTEREINSKPKFGGFTAPPKAEKPKPTELPGMEQYIPPSLYNNFVIYRPQNSADVEKLIDYLKRGEAAIIDLDPICDSPDAQRVLDFTSGAVYALGGKIAAIKPNVFLIVSNKGQISEAN